MCARFRSVLFWLLLLALPLQGFAAATMRNCGPGHHQKSEVAAVTLDAAESHPAASDGHHHAVVMADDHHAVVMADDHHAAASPAHAHVATVAQGLDNHPKFKCSACATCCMGVALPTATLAIASVPPAVTLTAFVPADHVDFLADGLDRPPRLSLV